MKEVEDIVSRVDSGLLHPWDAIDLLREIIAKAKAKKAKSAEVKPEEGTGDASNPVV
jgi:hypothetical protein